MLEFLREFDDFNIYNRAKDVELKLKSFDPISPMETFMEILLKMFFLNMYPNNSQYDLKGYTLSSMLLNTEFVQDIISCTKLHQSDFDFVDSYIRRKGNFYKHDLQVKSVHDEYVKNCFKCLFDFSCSYCLFSGALNVPSWSDEEYNATLDSAFSDNSRKALEEELTAKVQALELELSKELQEKLAAKREINELTEKIQSVQDFQTNNDDIIKLKSNISYLQAEIDKYNGQSIILKSQLANTLQDKLKAEKELEQIKQSSYDSLRIIDDRNFQIKKCEDLIFKSKSEIVKLTEDNNSLSSRIVSLVADKVKLEKKIKEYYSAYSDPSTIVKLESALKEAEAKRDIAELTITDLQAELEDIKSKLYISNSEIEALNKKFQENLLAKTRLTDILKDVGPRCPKCNSILNLNPSKYDDGFYWSCPGFKKGCDYQFKTLRGEELKYFKNVVSAIGGFPNDDTIILDKKKLDSAKSPIVSFFPYPDTFSCLNPVTYLFQSITVPSTLFNNRECVDLNQYSKFQMSSVLPSKKVSDGERTIYSLALRLLNRGIILPEYAETESALSSRFSSDNDYGTLDSLISYASYSNPQNPYDSEREKKFAEYYFPKILGNSWASYVFSQAGIDALTCNYSNQYKDQRVDFLICKNGRNIVIELDGPEHENNRLLDSQRDALLESCGYIVKRISNDLVDSNDSSIITELKNIIGSTDGEKVEVEIDNRRLVSSKICHQLAITIIKSLEQGLIDRKSNLKVSCSSEMFSSSELQYILSVAIAEVYAILKNYAEIYNVDVNWNFAEDTYPITTISIGEGNSSCKSDILIRDCSLSFNYLCDIEHFPDDILPQNPNEINLEFFLKYLFGHDHFRPGQYTAIRRLINREDTIVLLPTGSGKSTVYQLSSFICPGIIIVVSPIISLIEDQVVNLELNNGISNVIYFASSVTKDDKLKKEDSRRFMQHNSTSLIYISPERLMIPSFRDDVSLLMTHNSVYAIAIDEAHCVSEWGHDFRPAYLNVGNASRRLFSKNGRTPVVSALTGTASDAVLNDVRLDLGIRGYDALVQPDTFDRNELHFSVISCPSSNKDFHIANTIKHELPKKLGKTYKDFSSLGNSSTDAGIVFTPLASKQNSQYSALHLNVSLSNTLPALVIANYFSGTPKGYDDATWTATIRESARKFKNNQLNLLVATKAFGMGIDKPNVHYVIHDGIPSSFEQYYQEAGRAGRDRGNSQCVLVFSDDNEEDNQFFLDPSLSIEEFKDKYVEYSERVRVNCSEDDVSALLYFHNSAFQGIQSESEQIIKVLKHIVDEGFAPDKVVNVIMPTSHLRVNYNGWPDRKDVSNEEKKWIQALTRLIILGVVTDYTYDYRCHFSIRCGNLEKASIASCYSNYVAGSTRGREATEKNKILKSELDGLPLVEHSVKTLVEYIYDSIEKSRRRAITEMFNAAKEALNYSGDAQDSFIRNRIVSYFTYKGENRDTLKVIENGFNAGLSEILESFPLTKDDELSLEEKSQYKEISVMAGRLLESRPDHPGLLLAQAISSILSDNSVNSLDEGNIISAFIFANERYSVDATIIRQTAYQILSFVLRYSPDSFDSISGRILEHLNLSKEQLLSEMLYSNDISDSSREYLLSSYAIETLNTKWRSKNK